MSGLTKNRNLSDWCLYPGGYFLGRANTELIIVSAEHRSQKLTFDREPGNAFHVFTELQLEGLSESSLRKVRVNITDENDLPLNGFVSISAPGGVSYSPYAMVAFGDQPAPKSAPRIPFENGSAEFTVPPWPDWAEGAPFRVSVTSDTFVRHQLQFEQDEFATGTAIDKGTVKLHKVLSFRFEGYFTTTDSLTDAVTTDMYLSSEQDLRSESPELKRIRFNSLSTYQAGGHVSFLCRDVEGAAELSGDDFAQFKSEDPTTTDLKPLAAFSEIPEIPDTARSHYIVPQPGKSYLIKFKPQNGNQPKWGIIRISKVGVETLVSTVRSNRTSPASPNRHTSENTAAANSQDKAATEFPVELRERLSLLGRVDVTPTREGDSHHVRLSIREDGLLDADIEALTKFTGSISIDIFRQTKLTPAGYSQLGRIVGLKRLAIVPAKSGLAEKSVDELWKSLSGHKRLESLMFHSSQATATGYQALESMSSLNDLQLAGVDLELL